MSTPISQSEDEPASFQPDGRRKRRTCNKNSFEKPAKKTPGNTFKVPLSSSTSQLSQPNQSQTAVLINPQHLQSSCSQSTEILQNTKQTISTTGAIRHSQQSNQSFHSERFKQMAKNKNWQ